MDKIRDAYISVELKQQALEGFCSNLRNALCIQGFFCESASSSAHVSIAYGDGEVDTATACALAQAIASDSFEVRAAGFEILEGRSTPFDYLVLTLETSDDFEEAVDLVRQSMPTRTFHEGFKSHVSLLRFPKGSLETEEAKRLAQQLNSGIQAQICSCLKLEGDFVCVYNPQRERCVQVCFGGENSVSQVA